MLIINKNKEKEKENFQKNKLKDITISLILHIKWQDLKVKNYKQVIEK
jgi:hypothetical protein